MNPKRDLSGLRVLIVEDEALVSMLIDDTLHDLGCQTVSIAGNLPDALHKAAALDFDAAILDVNLHGEQTFPIAEQLCRRQIPFVFSTGYGADGIPPELRNVPVLQKPFMDHDLAAALNAALRGASS